MFLSKLKNIIALICLITITQIQLYSQSIAPNDIDTSDVNGLNIIRYGFDKIVNTYLFRADANINFPVLFGRVELFQKYSGTALKSNSTSFRDDEFLDFKYLYEIHKNLFVTVGQRWIYSSDSRSIGINKLEKLRSSGGLKYEFLNNSFLDATAGYEKNDQLGISSSGTVFNLNGLLNKYEIEDYNLSSRLFGEYITLKDSRNFNTFDWKGILEREFDSLNNLRIELRYRNLNQDFLHPGLTNQSDDYAIEKRVEDKLTANLTVNFSISELMNGGINLFVDNTNIDRHYNQYTEGSPLTGVRRNLNELNLNIAGDISYNSDSWEQNLSINYYSRNDENSLKNEFDIDKIEFNAQSKQENMKDNIWSRTQFTSRTLIEISKKDSLSFTFLSSIFRYNTPSNENNDDRDKLSLSSRIRYSHNFSEILKATLEGELQLEHLVFIKSERSAMNNWNRIIRLSPGISIQTKSFTMNPTFEIFANYTVYDFEYVSPGIESYLFRQLTYKDSINIVLTQRFMLKTSLLLGFFERGILYWDKFAESPEYNSFEHFSKVIFSYQSTDNLSFGSGARYYGLNQKNMGTYALYSNDIYHISFGPEIEVIYNIRDGMYFVLHGWYEYQKTNNEVHYRQIPNLFLETRFEL